MQDLTGALWILCSRWSIDSCGISRVCPSDAQNTNWMVVGTPTPLKNDGVKVSWDDETPNIWYDYSQYMESHKIHVPNHQPVMGSYMLENNPNIPNHQPAKNLLVVWLQSNHV